METVYGDGKAGLVQDVLLLKTDSKVFSKIAWSLFGSFSLVATGGAVTAIVWMIRSMPAK